LVHRQWVNCMDASEKSQALPSQDAPVRGADPRMFGLTKAAYSVKEALYLISIGRTAFYDLIKQKQLKPIKIGRRTLIGSDDIAALLLKLRKEVR
jgi:predicted DNA-binding transcriptional regulator AlpA